MARKPTDAKEDISSISGEVLPEQEIATPNFNFYLVVFNAFQKYRRGNAIYDSKTIQWVIDNGYLSNCNKVAR